LLALPGSSPPPAPWPPAGRRPVRCLPFSSHLIPHPTAGCAIRLVTRSPPIARHRRSPKLSTHVYFLSGYFRLPSTPSTAFQTPAFVSVVACATVGHHVLLCPVIRSSALSKLSPLCRAVAPEMHSTSVWGIACHFQHHSCNTLPLVPYRLRRHDMMASDANQTSIHRTEQLPQTDSGPADVTPLPPTHTRAHTDTHTHALSLYEHAGKDFRPC
jgi:hypothetical protein